jgi:hypothetical protein
MTERPKLRLIKGSRAELPPVRRRAPKFLGTSIPFEAEAIREEARDLARAFGFKLKEMPSDSVLHRAMKRLGMAIIEPAIPKVGAKLPALRVFVQCINCKEREEVPPVKTPSDSRVVRRQVAAFLERHKHGAPLAAITTVCE